MQRRLEMPEELAEEAPAAEEGAGGLSRSLTAPAAPQVEGQSWVGDLGKSG